MMEIEGSLRKVAFSERPQQPHQRPDTMDNSLNVESRGSKSEAGPAVVGALREFATATEMHGVRQLVTPEHGVGHRLVWFVCLFLSVGVLLTMVVSQVQRYFTFPIRTKVTIDSHPVLFPAITICNSNEVMMKRYTPEDMLGSAKNHFPHIGFNGTRFNFTSGDYNEANLGQDFMDRLEKINEAVWETIQQNGTVETQNITYRQFIDRAGYNLHDIVIFCLDFSTRIVCTDSPHFKVVYNYPFGKCHQLNHGSDFTFKGSGVNHGIMLQFKYHQTEVNTLRWQGQEDRSVIAELHSPYEKPDVPNSGFRIPMGKSMRLRIVTVRRLERLPAPYGDCVTGSGGLSHFTTYSEGACLWECVSKRMQSQFHCVMYDMVPLDNDTEVCPLTNPDVWNDYVYATSQLLLTNGTCTCSVPCSNNWLYVYTLETADLQRGADYSELFIYLDKKVVENVEQEEGYTTINLLAEVGGTVGLFIGASVLTLIHLVEFFATAFCAPCRSDRENK